MRGKLSGEAWREAADFIEANLPLTEVPGTGGVRLHLAGPRSVLSRLVPAGGTPYWAHAWPGGAALAMHIAAHPNQVRGHVTYDFGSGSGLVAIAAAKAHGSGFALDADPLAAVASAVNAQANGVSFFSLVGPPANSLRTFKPLAGVTGHLILAGDVFYDADTAAWMTAAFDALPRSTILIGDIGRAHLPRHRLEPLACYPVRDVGDPPDAEPREGWVYRWRHS